MAIILVVEDEFIIAKAIELHLKQSGHEVLDLALTGDEAINKSRHLRPDLVLMDIKLKGNLDGIFAAQQIQAQFDIPVVYLTAYSDADTLKRVIYSHAYGYLTKPFTPEGLNEAILKALAQHQMKKEREQLRYRSNPNPPPEGPNKEKTD